MTMTEAPMPTTEPTALDRVISRVRTAREAAMVAAPPGAPAPAPAGPPPTPAPAPAPPVEQNTPADLQSQLDDMGQAIEELAGNVQTLLAWMVECTTNEMDQQPDMLASLPPKFAGVTKSEGDAGDFPSSDYAYVPDPTMASTWKLRLTSSPGGAPDSGMVGAAAAALSSGGFRGNSVEIPDNDKPGVVAKVRAAWKKANPDKDAADMPDSIKE